jgi:hypothetical protein
MREPLDAAARDISIAARLSELLRDRGAARLFDLGSGTGANMRYLAPFIAGSQEWVLVDSDERHLEEARVMMATLPARTPAVRSIETRRVDMARDLDELRVEEGAIVTASALLDLVSSDWLTRLLHRCRACNAIALFALSYDGRIDLTPVVPGDESIRHLVNRHQRTDKGFGPALGPAAANFARTGLEGLRYQVKSASSDWLLSPSQVHVQEHLLRGWAQAAMEVAPSEEGRCERWLRARLEYLDRGQSSMLIGHQDVIGYPSRQRV